MSFQQLKQKADFYPVFKLEDVFKWFPQAKRQTVLNQLSFWNKKGYLEEIRRGIYKLRDYQIRDCFILSDFIYSPAYISLESGLNYYGVIPDVPFAITSVTINKTKSFQTKCCGIFSYARLKNSLFFGFKTIEAENNYLYKIASPEKTLFDYLYLRGVKVDNPVGFITELRLSFSRGFNWKVFKDWSSLVSSKNKKFHNLVKILLKSYAK